MTDYISREAFLEQYRSLYCSDCDGRKNSSGKIVYEIGDVPCRACDTGDMLDAIEDFPAADVVEVVHGRWIDGLDVPKEERERHPYVYLHGEKHCSVCYKEAFFDPDYGELLFDYCPYCGAKMDGERKDGDGDG